MSNEHADAAWTSLLDADLNSRYWRLMGLRYSRREGNAKIFLAVTASATVASWSLWEDLKLLWQSLSTASAVVSVALPIINVQEKADKMVAAQVEWMRLMHEYEELWRQRSTLDAQAYSAKLASLKAQEVAVSKSTAMLPSDDTKLAEACYMDVLKSRGLK